MPVMYQQMFQVWVYVCLQVPFILHGLFFGINWWHSMARWYG
jgi:hypothetical protein